jgi:membrane-associated phospholipid phosphatase
MRKFTLEWYLSFGDVSLSWWDSRLIIIMLIIIEFLSLARHLLFYLKTSVWSSKTVEWTLRQATFCTIGKSGAENIESFNYVLTNN